MKQMYFLKEVDYEYCYTKEYFDDYMRDNNLTEIEVFKAEKYKESGIFWCKREGICGDDSSQCCGKQCKAYSPRNGKSGCCKYYTTTLYNPGDKVTLKL